MTVYVIYDELKENILCVHALPNVECDICKPIRERDKKSSDKSYIKEFEKLVHEPEAKRYDSPAILDYYCDEEVEKRRIENISIADKENQEPEMQFFNRNTGKMQKLFKTQNKVFSVRYVNHEVGDKGEALYITLEAKNLEQAKDLALKNHAFTKYIQMKYYNRKYLSAYEPKGNYVIGKVEYFEGDPRL